MSTMAQLPGFDQGMLAGVFSGRTSEPASAKADSGAGPTREQLQRVLDELRASDDPHAVEMAGLLEAMLQGGMPLPPQQDPRGRSVPPFAALAQAASNAGVAPQQVNPENVTATLEQVLATTEGGVDEAVQDVQLESLLGVGQSRSAKFDTLLNRVEGVQVSAILSGSAAGSVPVSTVSVTGLPGSVSTQSLLSMPVPQPISDPAWGGAIGERLVWMARGDQQFAELKITPPNLGALEVRLSINNDQASVSFVSNHAAVRDAIESAIPRLREMLAEQSLNLVQAEVGSGREQSPDGSGTGQRKEGLAGRDGESEGPQVDVDRAATRTEASGVGVLDLFA